MDRERRHKTETAAEETTAAAGAGERAGVPPSVRTGAAVIAEFVKTLPRRPGVYRMYDARGDVLYVGKARDLKARVSSYARGKGHSNRITMMIAQVARLEVTTTRTEAEALLLEANLIKRLKPRYNILLRDDKSFPYILIDKSGPVARLTKHRGARRLPGSYWGPFASAGAVNRAISALEKAFLLRTCTDAVYANRTRPCLKFQIRRCAGPCTGEVSEEDYAALVRQAEAFLSGRSQKVKADLTREMEEAAERLDFERAAVLRDRLAAMAHVSAGQGVNPRTFETADLFALVQEGGQTCVQVFFFRAWQNWGNRAYFPRVDGERSAAEILAAFIAQFYDSRPIPPLILLSHALGDADQALLEEALSERAGQKVRLHVPKRGEKRDFVALALDNAREALARRLSEGRSQRLLLEGVARTFGLKRAPRRIDVFDNSHLQGTHAVGAMIVAGPEGFMKQHYRKFNMRQAPGDDDYAMMREVMRRRFARLVREAPGGPLAEEVPDGGFPQWPDLVLIDGGRGQLNAAIEVVQELGVPVGEEGVTFVGVAKGPERNAGRETFHLADGRILRLPERDAVLYYLQRLRDEAHRFAIGSHRLRRKGAARKSLLDGIPGIGPARKKALLAAFGSARGVARAEVSELAAVEGISENLARTIYDYLHGDG